VEKQQVERADAIAPVSSETSSVQWVAPLGSLETFSIAEFTRIDAFPGDDGLGAFTQS